MHSCCTQSWWWSFSGSLRSTCHRLGRSESDRRLNICREDEQNSPSYWSSGITPSVDWAAADPGELTAESGSGIFLRPSSCRCPSSPGRTTPEGLDHTRHSGSFHTRSGSRHRPQLRRRTQSGRSRVDLRLQVEGKQKLEIRRRRGDLESPEKKENKTSGIFDWEFCLSRWKSKPCFWFQWLTVS